MKQLVLYWPCFCKVGPVCHDYSTKHDVIFREVTWKEVGGSHHGNAKHIGELITVGRVRPIRPGLGLTMMVEGVEKDRRLELSMQLGCGHSRGHPLVVREQSQEGLPTHVTVVPIGPVCVHELDGLPQDIFILQETNVKVSMCDTAFFLLATNLWEKKPDFHWETDQANVKWSDFCH